MHRLPSWRHVHAGLHAHSHLPAYLGNRASPEVRSIPVSEWDGRVPGQCGRHAGKSDDIAHRCVGPVGSLAGSSRQCGIPPRRQDSSPDLNKWGRRAYAPKEEMGIFPIGHSAEVDQPVAPGPPSFSVPSICRRGWESVSCYR